MNPMQPVWPPPPATPYTGPPAARIIVNAGFFPLAYIYAFFTPTITINGYKESRPWGTYIYDVPVGDYEVAVSYPWLFAPECGRNQVRFSLRQGEIRTVTYEAGMIRFLPGKISVS